MSKISINHIGHAHSDWLRSLSFYKQELDILKARLTEIGGKNTSKEVAVQLEQYENQMKVQRDNMDRLEHSINSNLSEMSRQAQEQNGAGYIDRDYVDSYNTLQHSFTMEEKVVNGLRHDFNKFSATWM